MAERRTHENDASVDAFIDKVKNATRREDARVIVKMMAAVSRKQPKMWGPSIIGFGTHQYTLANGKSAEICKIGFSPRVQSLVFYLANFDGKSKLLARLGKHRHGVGCLYVNRLTDIDLTVLRSIIEKSYRPK